VNTLTYTLIVYGIAALILDVLVLVRREQVWYFSGSSYMWLIALGVIPQLFGHSIFNWSLEILPASIVSIALLGEPIGSTLLAYLFLSETPTIFEIVGGLVILAGIVLAYFPRKKVNAI
jgi:drug/metabolite transporter (DMT)-like permease